MSSTSAQSLTCILDPNPKRKYSPGHFLHSSYCSRFVHQWLLQRMERKSTSGQWLIGKCLLKKERSFRISTCKYICLINIKHLDQLKMMFYYHIITIFTVISSISVNATASVTIYLINATSTVLTGA